MTIRLTVVTIAFLSIWLAIPLFLFGGYLAGSRGAFGLLFFVLGFDIGPLAKHPLVIVWILGLLVALLASVRIKRA